MVAHVHEAIFQHQMTEFGEILVFFSFALVINRLLQKWCRAWWYRESCAMNVSLLLHVHDYLIPEDS